MNCSLIRQNLVLIFAYLIRELISRPQYPRISCTKRPLGSTVYRRSLTGTCRMKAVDSEGVALAAIQALYREKQRLEDRLEALESRLATLESSK